MIVFAETPHPECLILKYVKYAVPAPAATNVVPRRTFPSTEDRPADPADDTVSTTGCVETGRTNDDLADFDALERSATTLNRDNWFLAEQLLERPTAADTRERSAMDGLPQLEVGGGRVEMGKGPGGKGRGCSWSGRNKMAVSRAEKRSRKPMLITFNQRHADWSVRHRKMCCAHCRDFMLRRTRFEKRCHINADLFML